MLSARQILRAVEPLVFNYRIISLCIIALITAALATCAVALFVFNTETNFQKGLPTEHEYIENFNTYQDQFGGGDVLAIVVENTAGNIYNREYLERLSAIEERVRALPGIDRSRYRSLFSEDTRYYEIVEGGFSPQRVLLSNWRTNQAAIDNLSKNVDKAGLRGLLVGLEGTSSLLVTDLFANNPLFIDDSVDEEKPKKAVNPALGDCTPDLPADLNFAEQFPPGEELNYVALAKLLEEQVRQPCETDAVKIRILGSVMVVGEIVDSFTDIVLFFGIALVLSGLLLWAYCGSLRLAVLPLICSVVAVFWELGILYLIGYSLDPFAVLIPFLTLAVGVSHGVQFVNCWAAEVGTHHRSSFDASVVSFRRLAIPGTTALITDVIGFLAILMIPIAMVEEMAVNAALGVAAIIITNKWLMPILLSYTKLSNPQAFAKMQARRETGLKPIFHRLSSFTERKTAIVIIVVSLGLLGVSLWQGQHLQVGDFKPGAAQLKPDSRFNRDVAQYQTLYGRSQDIFQIIVDGRAPVCREAESEADNRSDDAQEKLDQQCELARKAPACLSPAVMAKVNQLSLRLQATPNVLNVISLPTIGKIFNSGMNSGRLTQYTMVNSIEGLKLVASRVPSEFKLRNTSCDIMAIRADLTDHRAATLERVIAEVESFIDEYPELPTDTDTPAPMQPQADIKLASGNAGIAAAVNQVVEQWEKWTLLFVYAAIILMCLLSFRSITSSLCVLLPLALVSMMTYAVMAWLEIGLTVATLPVAAFGVGLGVDYGIYIFSTILDRIKAGSSLRQAYYETLQTTGRAVLFTGVALSIGVLTWLFSSLQFQADMGLILVFMFLANMLGAIVILPALAHFLVDVEKVRREHEDLAA